VYNYKKSKILIEKLETLTSIHPAKHLRKNRDIDERIKMQQEQGKSAEKRGSYLYLKPF
jgi:hypothetical protein